MSIVRSQAGSEKVTIDGEKVRKRMNLATLNTPIFNPIANLYTKSSIQATYAIGADDYGTFLMIQEGRDNYYLYKLNEISKKWEQYTDNNFYARGIPVEITTPTKTNLLYPSWQSNYIMSCKNGETNWETIGINSNYVPLTSGKYLEKLKGCVMLKLEDSYNATSSKCVLLNDDDNSITELLDFPQKNQRENYVGSFLTFKNKLYFFNRSDSLGVNLWNWYLWSFDGDAWSKECEIQNTKIISSILYHDDEYIYFYTSTGADSDYKVEEWKFKDGEVTKTRELVGLSAYIFNQKGMTRCFKEEAGFPGRTSSWSLSMYGEFYRTGLVEI